MKRWQARGTWRSTRRATVAGAGHRSSFILPEEGEGLRAWRPAVAGCDSIAGSPSWPRCRAPERPRLRHALNAHQVGDVALALRQVVDGFEHAAAIRSQVGVAAGRGGHQPFAELDGGRALI